ncbi:Ig-like domain-containing protein [Haliangium sp.]|uniref:Ig-like domain-containing protein n=1 Tax=Haliangium sp. TaxID=2663208 RepID=UPI003D139DFB
MSRFVRMSIVCALTVALAAVSGCDDAEIKSDLDTSGSPRVTSVTVSTEGAGEAPTFCGDPDEDKVTLLCFDGDGLPIEPDPATDVTPQGWYVRLVFNELLNPDRAEELVIVRDSSAPDGIARDQYNDPVLRGTLENSQPVNLVCGGAAVPYDGFYNPSGNHLSVPPGPSLVVQARAYVATETDCTIEVVQGESTPGFGVFDKSGNPVDAGKRGPFGFRIAPIAVDTVDPDDEADGVALDAVAEVVFNAPVDAATLNDGGAARIVLREAGGADVAVSVSVDGDTVTLTPTAALTPQTDYEIVVSGGVADIAGGPGLALAEDPTVLSTFTTGDAPAVRGGD